MRSERIIAAQIVGFGAAGLGVAVAADRKGVLASMLSDGVIFMDRARDHGTASAQRFPWRALSNSPGCDFLRSIDHNGLFAQVLDSQVARSIRACPTEPVWLQEVALLMADIAARVEAYCAEHTRSAVHYGAAVASVSVEENGTFVSYDAAGRALVHSRSIVIATGADEQCGDAYPFARAGAQVIFSGAVMAGRISPILAALEQGNRVTILGSSHSAFCVADMLLRDLGNKLRPGQLRVACRRSVDLYFASVEEARTFGAALTQRSICPETGAVNRFNGLRGNAKTLYLKICDGDEKRIELMDNQSLHPTELGRGDVVITATGYTPRRVRFRRADGQPLMLRYSRSFGHVSDECQLVARSGYAIPGAFGMGIGYPRLDSSNRGSVGVNRFHGPDGSQVVDGIMRCCFEREARIDTRARFDELTPTTTMET